MLNIHRTLPQSLDAEKGVLCSALLSPGNVLGECIERLSETHFYQPAHRIIYREMVELQNAGKPIDFITLTQALKDKGELDKSGGAAAISELTFFVPTSSNVDYYIDIVREKFLLRQLIQTCTEFAGRAYDEQGDSKLLLNEFETSALSLGAVNTTSGETKRLSELFNPAVQRYEHAFKNRDTTSLMGLTTGIERLDRITGGMLPEQMIVIGAREKFGKSALAFNIATHVGITLRKGVGIISLEMSERQLVDRYYASHGRVNLTNLRDGTFTTQDMSKILKASAEGKSAPIFIRTESDITVMQIRAIARRLRATEKIELLMIDYLQLIQPADRREKSRQVQIAEISREIKLCAKELGIPVVVLSQLNKDGETRESLSLQQDCDQMWRIVPPAPRVAPRKGKGEAQTEEPEEEPLNRPCFIDVKYNREGETGLVPMTFLRPFTLFQDRYD